MRRFLLIATMLIWLAGGASMAAAEEIPLEDFVEHPDYKSVSISPDGRHLAVAAPSEDQTGLAIIRIGEDKSLSATASFVLRSGEHVADVVWANDERALFTTERQAGTLARPNPTGRIYGVDVDGSNQKMLYGTEPGARVFRRAEILSRLPGRDDRVLIQEYAHDRSYPRALQMDVNDGRTGVEAVSPLENGGLVADHDGVVRFAYGTDEERNNVYSYRESKDGDWQDFESDLDGEHIQVHGFAENNRDIYLTSRETGRMGLYRLDTETGESERLLGSDTVEVSNVLWDRDGDYVIGAVFADGRPEMRFIDEDDPSSVLQRQIARAFPRQFSRIVSFAGDSSRAIVGAQSDISPPGYFLFDTESMQADYLLSSREQIDPNQMLPVEPIQLESRDGVDLHGYLIEPEPAEEGRPHPLIVRVHGGPHGLRDHWSFDPEMQLLANRGYAVLTVNFRGSGGYGHEFEEAGYREWGRAMQDDVTDATRWAVEQGITDSDSVCIYGGSYGGYATLAGLTREPDLYACGAANVGIYDLPLMFEKGDIPERERGRAYLREVLGQDEEELKANSPARHVERIEAPLFLAHGEEDNRAHFAHFEFLTEQLDEAEIPYESQVFEEEGHGYYEMDNRLRFSRGLLEFFDRHIGE